MCFFFKRPLHFFHEPLRKFAFFLHQFYKISDFYYTTLRQKSYVFTEFWYNSRFLQHFYKFHISSTTLQKNYPCNAICNPLIKLAIFSRYPLTESAFFRDPLQNLRFTINPFTKFAFFKRFFEEICVFSWLIDKIRIFTTNLWQNFRFSWSFKIFYIVFRGPLTKFSFSAAFWSNSRHSAILWRN